MSDVDRLAAALAVTVRARRETNTDAAVVSAMSEVTDFLRLQLEGLQDRALAEAESAFERFQDAYASGDRTAASVAFRAGQEALAHADEVSSQVAVALSKLASGLLEVTGPALQHLQEAVDATDALIRLAESRTYGGAS